MEKNKRKIQKISGNRGGCKYRFDLPEWRDKDAG